MANQQFDERVPILGLIGYASGQSGSVNDLFSLSGVPVRLDAVFITNADSIDHTVSVGFVPGSEFFEVATVVIPAPTAPATAVTVEVLSANTPGAAPGLVTNTPEAFGVNLGEAAVIDQSVRVVAVGGTL